ncbi:MAG: general secretion pathway protein GspK [Deltaproteobacteria bacterium]|nr:general secretion pathway protein GspK [Deltaproteobacteria bacterium]
MDNGQKTKKWSMVHGPWSIVHSPWSIVHGPQSKRGIALLLVLGAIVMLTMLAVAFAYDSQIEYHQSIRQKERLQAYYLASSAYNLVRLELKIGNSIQSQINASAASAGMQLPMDLSNPLCKQFPMKTALFRLFLSGESPEEPKKEGEEGEEKTPKEKEEASQMMAGFALAGVEEFLKFEGDFDGECTDENSKIDLNYIYSQDPLKKELQGENGYDAYKHFLMSVLSQSADLFKNEDLKIVDVVRNIADWVDSNEVVNDFGGSEAGSEDSIYRNRLPGQMATKNGKFSLPADIFLVEGVRDSWWGAVSDLFTIYGATSSAGKPQINACRAPNEVVKSLILRYTETRTDLPPIKPTDEEILDQLVQAVKEGCTGAVPDKNKIAQSLDAKLLEVLKAAPAPQTPSPAGTGGYAPQPLVFADWIATQSRFFSLKLTGQVNDTVIKINTVIDLGQGGGSDTTKWKTLYWKVE